ncbi:MAG: cation:proton antiporter, partial [Woeseiaceae bacterium]
LGPVAVRHSARIMGRLDIVEAKMFTSYLFVMVLAWIANLVGLATIVGAFAAGVVLSDSYFSAYENDKKQLVSIRQLIMPLEVILVPIFFILMGIQVKLESFTSLPVLIVASGLLVAAILGKLVSGLGARRKLDRLVIGIGMMPRGEVGLVFAAIGRALGVIDDGLFSAIVLMVMVTTLISPPLLKAAINRRGSNAAVT